MQSIHAREGGGLTREMQRGSDHAVVSRTRGGKGCLGPCSSPTSGWDWKRLDSCSRDLSDSIGFSGFSNRILSDFNGSVAAQSEIAIEITAFKSFVFINSLKYLCKKRNQE